MNKKKNQSSEPNAAEFVKNSYKLKPDGLIMSELKWKYLVRSALRGKNILLVGPTGSGKTFAAQSLAKALEKEDNFFYINMGAMQDPRTSLIGNTHFKKDSGTFFDESPFIKAIRTPGCIILLDELSRGHPDSWNILMTALDELQRYVRLDEKEGSETIKVAPGVTFVATANIGNEYTATRVMDRALLDRFQVKIEVDVLSAEQERGLIKNMDIDVDEETLIAITSISEITRVMARETQLTNAISTRAVVEMASLAADGFAFLEVVEAIIYPNYSEDGGLDSERTLIKQVVQKFIKGDSEKTAATEETPF